MTVSAQDRAQRLLDEIRAHGWSIEFVQARTGKTVHVVAADADQPPPPADIVEHLMVRRFQTICGPLLRFGPYGGTLNHAFPDERLCRPCHDAFIGPDAQALLFEHNADSWQSHAASNNAHTRQLRRIDEDRNRM